MALYMIATEREFDRELVFWSNTDGWSDLEKAEVYTRADLKLGVKLPPGGFWIRFSSRGIRRL